MSKPNLYQKGEIVTILDCSDSFHYNSDMIEMIGKEARIENIDLDDPVNWYRCRNEKGLCFWFAEYALTTSVEIEDISTEDIEHVLEQNDE